VLYDLHASPDVSLPTALEQLAAMAAHQSGLAISASCLGAARPLNASQQAILLRCAQEALLNVRQHARAHSAQLTLSFEPRAVVLSVQDDGVGLLDGTYERPGLHALRAVRYRLAELDGQLAVFDSEGGGLTLRATLPLD
jgi:signal transduction histidine kinase